MPNYNKVILAGHLTRDPELKPVGDSQVCNFGLAVSRKYKDKESVLFMDCAAWGKQGETIAKYCTKGKPLLVEGRLEQQNWEKDGQKRSKVVMIVEQFQFLGGKGGDTAKAGASARDEGEEMPF